MDRKKKELSEQIQARYFLHFGEFAPSLNLAYLEEDDRYLRLLQIAMIDDRPVTLDDVQKLIDANKYDEVMEFDHD